MCVFQSQLDELDYDDGRVEQLEAEQHALNQQIGGLQEKVDRLESRSVGQSLHQILKNLVILFAAILLSVCYLIQRFLTDFSSFTCQINLYCYCQNRLMKVSLNWE